MQARKAEDSTRRALAEAEAQKAEAQQRLAEAKSRGDDTLKPPDTWQKRRGKRHGWMMVDVDKDTTEYR